MIGVGGCWAQSVKDEVFRQFPFVDVAFGPARSTSSPSSSPPTR
jgi:tRNA-2-methylthio-N6-dimethylallyladenosine synthase